MPCSLSAGWLPFPAWGAALQDGELAGWALGVGVQVKVRGMSRAVP